MCFTFGEVLSLSPPCLAIRAGGEISRRVFLHASPAITRRTKDKTSSSNAWTATATSGAMDYLSLLKRQEAKLPGRSSLYQLHAQKTPKRGSRPLRAIGRSISAREERLFASETFASQLRAYLDLCASTDDAPSAPKPGKKKKRDKTPVKESLAPASQSPIKGAEGEKGVCGSSRRGQSRPPPRATVGRVEIFRETATVKSASDGYGRRLAQETERLCIDDSEPHVLE